MKTTSLEELTKKLLSAIYIHFVQGTQAKDHSKFRKGDLFWFGDFNIWVSVEINLTIRCE